MPDKAVLIRHEKVAPRARELPPSGIRAFFDLAAGNNDIISLGVGEPDFPAPLSVREACMRLLEDGDTAYTPNAGMPELREEISRYMGSRFGLDYSPEEEIFVTVGSSEALDLALRALVAPGDEVIVPGPGYVAYGPMAHLSGGTVVWAQTCAEDGFRLTAEALERALTPRSRVLMVNFPGNPTGAVMTEADWQEIARIVVERDLIVLSDEVYAELTYGSRHVSPASLPGMKERTVVISGFSKAFAMTGWRIGYVCGPSELLGPMLRIHQYTAMCAPTLSQIGALAALRSAMPDMERMKAEFRRRRALVVDGLQQLGLPCHEPAGAFYAFPSIAHFGLTSEQFALRLLQEAKVAVVPGSVFGADGEGHIRLSYAASEAKLTGALERIGRFIHTKM